MAVFSAWKAGVTWINMCPSAQNYIIIPDFSPSISIALSLKLSLYLPTFPLLLHISLLCISSVWQPLYLCCHLLFHLPTPLHQSAFALFFLSAYSLPKEPWGTNPAVSVHSPFPFPTPLFLSHLQSLSPRKCCRGNSRGDSAWGPSVRHSDPLLS